MGQNVLIVCQERHGNRRKRDEDEAVEQLVCVILVPFRSKRCAYVGMKVTLDK